ncbi:MAG: helix-turn-helix transcriptional regulator [Gammaproteobacteria bacterium]|nr:helix-turn-helix transcriptional regulator [Gammaproteobacteria bacterium]
MSNDDFYDVGAELDAIYGKQGTQKHQENLDKAWEEYNAHVLLDARLEAGLTQSEVAERLGVNKAYISKIERGLIVPSVALFYRLTNALGKQVEIT